MRKRSVVEIVERWYQEVSMDRGYGAGDYGTLYSDDAGDGVSGDVYGEALSHGQGEYLDYKRQITLVYGAMDEKRDWGVWGLPGNGWGKGLYGIQYQQNSDGGCSGLDDDPDGYADAVVNYVKAKNAGIPDCELDLEFVADPLLSRFEGLINAHPYP